MYCPFCKEEIQTDTTVGGACNAEKIDGDWKRRSTQSHANAPHPKAGRFTIRTAAVFFFISVIFELFTLRSEVPILGRVYGGWIAVVYHSTYACLFGAMGMGLWSGRAWGIRIMLLGTIVYTFDKGLYLADKEGQLSELQRVTGDLGELANFIEPELFLQATNLAIALILACWWGFMAYLYFRRDYFASVRNTPND